MGGGRQSASSSCWGSPFCSDRCFLRANQRSAGQPAFGVINSSLPLRFLDVLFQWQGILFSWCCLSCCPDRYFCSANQRSTGQSTFGVMNSSLQFRFLGFLFQKKSGLWSWSGLPCCSDRCSCSANQRSTGQSAFEMLSSLPLRFLGIMLPLPKSTNVFYYARFIGDSKKSSEFYDFPSCFRAW